MTWGTVRVGDIAQQIRGVTYIKDEASSTPLHGHVAILRAGNIGDAGLVLDDLVHVPAARVSDSQLLRPNDVVIATSSGSLSVVGKAARVLDPMDASFGAFCKVLRPVRRIDPAYFAHFFRTPSYRRHISSVAAGANINNLRSDDLDRIEIPLPPLAEQRRIAAILDEADSLRISARHRLALVNESSRDAVERILRRAPVSKPLAELVGEPLRNGISPSKTGSVVADVLTLSAITRGRFDPRARKTDTFTSSHGADKLVREGLHLICRGNGNADLVGAMAVANEDLVGVAFPDTMIAMRPSVEISSAALEAAWRTEGVREQIRRGARTTNGTYKVNQQVLAAVRVPVNTTDQQQSIGRIELERSQSAHRLTQSITLLDELFASLQHRAFRGEL
ncbi:restriction endonuclease subunit S [Microbacterium sp. RU33B]|uniref:restriction endonuclease subunit S n=1 Tax=Microbacterium sp. RU33B TaxID=1907390 RepID=UPI0009682269|nr:restriction endonuclease subunit S [Microbacterium sp. RU33B]SIT74162.1 type I restriction enzyme, S subunit [Microbacterium sp. RU33B]